MALKDALAQLEPPPSQTGYVRRNLAAIEAALEKGVRVRQVVEQIKSDGGPEFTERRLNAILSRLRREKAKRPIVKQILEAAPHLDGLRRIREQRVNEGKSAFHHDPNADTEGLL